jgi:hypothetical protein
MGREGGVGPSVPKCSSPGHGWQRRCSCNEKRTTVQRRLQAKMGQELTGQYSSNKLSSCGSKQRAGVSVRAKVVDRSRRGVTRLRARRQVGRRPSVSLALEKDRPGRGLGPVSSSGRGRWPKHPVRSLEWRPRGGRGQLGPAKFEVDVSDTLANVLGLGLLGTASNAVAGMASQSRSIYNSCV